MNSRQPLGHSIRPLFEPTRKDTGDPGEEARDDGEDLPRPMTRKERSALQESKLARRMRWLLERRADDGGRVYGGRLREARETKFARMKELGMERAGQGGIVAGPAGPGNNWLSVGPRNINGRIKCLAVDPTNGQTLYAGSAAGGVWKTTNGGQSWTPTMHDEASLAIGAIAVDPSVPQTIYAGTGEPVHYISLPVTLPLTYVSWFYEGEGVYKSTDGGGTWTLTGPIGNEFIYRIAVDPFDSSHVLCAGFSTPAGAGGLCRSTDGGATWTTVQAGVFTDVLFDPVNAGRAYAGQNNGGVLKSIDSGATWTPKNAGLPVTTSMGRVSLSLAAAIPDVLYAMIEDDASGGLLGVYRTATAAEGAGWAAVTAPPVSPFFVWWCQHIEADPTDAAGNVVWAGAVDVARSGDGGATWVQVTDAYGGSQPPTHSDQHMLVFDPADSDSVYIANDGGVFHGQYVGGATPVDWVKVSTGLVATQFYDLHSSSAQRSMFGGGTQDNGSLITTGGLSYRHVYGGDGGYVAFHPSDPYTVYVQSQGANIQKSTDGASTFITASSGIGGGGPFPATVLVMDPTNPLILFSGTDAVYRTANGGTSWSDASPSLGTVTEVAIAPSSSAVLYAGTVNGGLHQATDGGVTATSFVDITPGVAGWPSRWLSGIAVDPADSNTVYVSFLGFNGTASSDHVWKGVFSGAWTWVLRAGGLPDVPVGAIVFDPATSDLYVATDVGVFKSTDDGVSWAPFEIGLPNVPVVDLALDPVRNLLRAATHGRGMYQCSIAAATPQVDIYLRDNLVDTGEVIPCPSGVPDPTLPGAFAYHWHSVDIKVDADPYAPTDAVVDGVEFDDPEHPYTGFGEKIEEIAGIPHENPVRTEVNRVYVQVHNRGWDTAAQVDLKLLYADAGAGLPALPADFWSNYATDAYDQTVWKLIGNHTFSNVLPAVPQVWRFNWTPPMSVSNHVCLLAMVDSPQDSLNPGAQTELHPDVLTPNNKRITHRNTHPVDPTPSPGGRGWATLNFNNGFRENRFFDLSVENLVGVGRLRVVLPRLTLRDDLEQALHGLQVAEVSADELHRTAKAQLEAGEMSEYLARLILENEEPLVLDTLPDAAEARVRGVLIKAGDAVPAVFAYAGADEKGDGAGLRFEVIQYDEKAVVGGSAFYVPGTLAVAPTFEAAGGGGRLRIVLEKVQVLDDRDPWIFGRGELSFTAGVYVEGETTPRRVRIPATGALKVSDRAGKNVVELDETLFEGEVPAGRRLTLALHATEHDMLNDDDESTRYRRTFSGEARTWVGAYGPGDGTPDAEAMPDWRVWYRIEEV